MKIDINKEYRTRDGREVRIHTDDMGGDFPILATIKSKDGWGHASFTGEGNLWAGEKSKTDLVTIQEDYLRRQAECGLKVGDRVRITRVPEGHEDGWNCTTAPSMDILKDTTGFITEIHDQGVKMDHRWSWPYFVLEKVEEPQFKENGIPVDLPEPPELEGHRWEPRGWRYSSNRVRGDFMFYSGDCEEWIYIPDRITSGHPQHFYIEYIPIKKPTALDVIEFIEDHESSSLSKIIREHFKID